MNLLNKSKPKLVDYSFYSKPKQINKPINISISFYFNIIITLLIILGLLSLYYRYITKENYTKSIKSKIEQLNNKINLELKNIT